MLFRNVCYAHACQYEPRHDKTNKVTVRPAKTQISLGIRNVYYGHACQYLFSLPLGAIGRL